MKELIQNQRKVDIFLPSLLVESPTNSQLCTFRVSNNIRKFFKIGRSKGKRVKNVKRRQTSISSQGLHSDVVVLNHTSL